MICELTNYSAHAMPSYCESADALPIAWLFQNTARQLVHLMPRSFKAAKCPVSQYPVVRNDGLACLLLPGSAEPFVHAFRSTR